MDVSSPAQNTLYRAARVAELFTLSYHLAYAQVDANLRVQQTSPNFAATMQLTATNVPQQPVTRLFPQLQTAVPYLKEMLQGKRDYYRLDYGHQANTGTGINYYIVHLYHLNQHDPQAGLLLILENRTHLQKMVIPDETELLQAQEQLAQANAELHRVNRIKSLFMSMAAHDLRTPLTTIFGFADMLMEDLDLDNMVRREILGVMRAQSERLSRLIADLLDVERIEQGNLILKTTPCNLNQIVHEVIQSLKSLCEVRRLVIVADLPNPSLEICGDETRIWQILYNLVSNAIKYTAEHSQITIKVYREDDEAILQVSDSGRGMTEEQLERLFDLYYRTDEAKASTVLGSGLGLYIVKTMAEAHNGTVTVASEMGKSTTFTVRLPLDLQNDISA